MKDIHVVYDSLQHCTALKKSKGKTISMDCPHTGKGEEFSPTNLIESALGGCILMAVGTYAMQHAINMIGAKVNVQITATDKPRMRFSKVEVNVTMPEGISEKEGKRLERAAESCPIKQSFGNDIPVKVKYFYPTLSMA